MAVKRDFFFFFYDLLGHKVGSPHWGTVMEHIFTSVDAAAAASSNSASVVETFTMLISQKQTPLSSDTSCAVEKRLCLAPQCTSSHFPSFVFCFSFCFLFLTLQSPAALCLQSAHGVPDPRTSTNVSQPSL